MPKNGLFLLSPTSVAYSGTSASINANGSVSFTACDSVSLNGVFRAGYDNYQVVMWYEAATSSSGTLKCRMRLSGTDNTSSTYTTQYLSASTTTVSGFRQTTTSAELNQFGYDPSLIVGTFYAPFIAQPTVIRTVTQGMDSTVATPTIYDCAIGHQQSVAYDGFSFLTGSGLATLTGRVSVYGMRK